MTLSAFLKYMKKDTQYRIIYPMKIEDTKEEVDEKIANKSYLFDVVEWHLEMNNYQPLVVVKVK
jgi:hypothetical protein